MALSGVFPLSVSQIRTEYGLSGPVSLRTFVGQSGFPASGPISMSDFLGKSAPTTLAAFISGAPSGSRTGTGSVTTSAATASATGGAPGYTYAWTYVSGTAFTIDSPTSATTTFTQTVTAGATINAVYRCTVTDSLGATSSSDVAISATATVIPALSVSISGDPSGTRLGAGSVTTGAATAAAAGGTPGYSYFWERVSGDTFTINSASSAATTFTTTLSSGLYKEGVYRCTATDGVSATAFADVTVYAESFGA